MTIKDIAKAANVSAATVSRIINQKDDNISQETRDRVLRIIQENNYVPYAKIRERILSQTRSIGLVIPTLLSDFYVQFASEMQQLTRERSYSLVLALASGSSKDELATLNEFSQNRTDGVLFFSGTDEGLARLGDLHQQGMGAVILNHYRHPSSLPQLYRDSTEIARQCTQQLLDNNCTQIGLVLRPSSSHVLHEAIIAGYSAALTAAGLPIRRNYITMSDGDFVENFRSMVDTGLTGLVCQYVDSAQIAYSTAAIDGIRIPGDLSVISMEDSPDVAALSPALTAAQTDVKEMARMAFECLLSQIEHTPQPFSSQVMDCPIQHRGSIRMRRDTRARIVVAGFINTDTLLRTPDLPQYGKTQVSAYMADYVGGKGANQAFGISKLGGNAFLLGCLGSDRRGRFIYDHLTQAGIRMDGVSFQPDLPTGTAYISLYPNGRSSVLINPGANTMLDPEYISRHEHLLKDACYCLVQTDIPMESVVLLRRLCDRHRVPMVLHPSYGRALPGEVLRGLSILIIKEQELKNLYPHISSTEECAAFLLEQGVENVCICREVSSCLWASANGLRHYPAYDYPRKDETGASDAFTASLITLLSEGSTMDEAIRAACWVAAYSATQLGVQNGFPDRKLMDNVISGFTTLHFCAGGADTP